MDILPDNIIDLLDSYDINCHVVERMALNSVTAVDATVFGVLRDLPCNAIITALNRLDKWFGKGSSLERCICLITITDYVSCAYQHKWFYNTFNHALTTKFIDNLFAKLWIEWQKIFGTYFFDFPSKELNSVRKMLRMSADRFPQHFRHRQLMERIVSLSENYSNQKPTVLSKNIVKGKVEDKKTCSVQLSTNFSQLNTNPILPNSESVKGSTNSEPAKEAPEEDCDCQIILTKVRKISKYGDMARYMVPKENTIPENTVNGIKFEPKVTRSLCALASSQTSSVTSDLEKGVIDITNCDDECDEKVASISHTKEPLLPKKLNAFDILMRRATLKKKAVH